MRLDIARTTLLEKIDAYLDAERERVREESTRYRHECEVFANALHAELGHFLSRLRSDPQATISGSMEDYGEATVVISRSSSAVRVNVTSLQLPATPQPVDAHAERDRELVANSSKLTISIGPDDHLYRYLAHPDADARRRR